MLDLVTRLLRFHGSFSDEEITLFAESLKARDIPKGGSVLQVNEVCREVSIIEQGSFIQYYRDQELNDVIVNLFVPHDWLLSRSSFTSQKASKSKIEAFEDSRIHTVSMDDLHQLIGKHPAFFALGRILEVTHSHSDPKHTPDKKYELLLQEKPQLVQKFPLKHVASYLNMTPETLSRVRSRIS